MQSLSGSSYLRRIRKIPPGNQSVHGSALLSTYVSNKSLAAKLVDICVYVLFVTLLDFVISPPVLSTGSGVWTLMAMVSCPCLSWSISMKNSVRGWKGWVLNLCPSRIYSARCWIWLNLKAQVSATTSLPLIFFPILISGLSFLSVGKPQPFAGLFRPYYLNKYVCIIFPR